MWEAPHSYDDPTCVQTCTHFPWRTESPRLSITALCWLDGYVKALCFCFFSMAEATTIILFKMLPLLMKILWGQEICTQNAEGLRVRKRKRLCEWEWGITRLDAHIQAKVINEKLRGCEIYRGKYILAVEWINWRLLRRKNSLVWRIHNLCNTWKDSTETEYEKTEKGKWFCGFHERSTFLIQDKTGHLIRNQRVEPRVKTSSEQEQGWRWA